MIGVLFNPITILLATLAIQWVAIAEVGSYTIQLPYATFLLVALYAVSGPKKLSAVAAYVRSNAAWLIPWAIYLFIITAVLKDSEGSNIGPRQIFYLFAGVALGGCIAATRNIRIIFRLGAALGLIAFVVTIEILARRIGLSWLDAIDHFINDGNLKFVIYFFFRAIFNSLQSATGELISAARKNDVAACILVLGLVFRSASSAPQRDWAGMIVLAFTLGLLILLNTRSVLIVGGMGLIMATLLGTVMRPGKNSGPTAIKLLGLAILLVLAVQYSITDTAASAMLGERFSFDDYSAEARLNQLTFAIQAIEQHPWTGMGYVEVDEQRIHNLFLGAWIHAGLFAFLLVVLFYFVIVVRWVRIVVGVARNPRSWVLPIAFEWLATLPILPFFRVWLSGDAGHPFISEWIALSIFFGTVLANELWRKKSAGRLGAPVRSQAPSFNAGQGASAGGLAGN